MFALLNDINYLLNEEPFKRDEGHYYAVVLTPESAEKVEELAIYDDIPKYHVTISFEPTVKIAEQLSQLIDRSLVIQANGLYDNGNVNALFISEMKFKKNGQLLKKIDAGPNVKPGPAHITVSLRKGHKRRESNQMLLDYMKNPPQPDSPQYRLINMKLDGVFQRLQK